MGTRVSLRKPQTGSSENGHINCCHLSRIRSSADVLRADGSPLRDRHPEYPGRRLVRGPGVPLVGTLYHGESGGQAKGLYIGYNSVDNKLQLQNFNLGPWWCWSKDMRG